MAGEARVKKRGRSEERVVVLEREAEHPRKLFPRQICGIFRALEANSARNHVATMLRTSSWQRAYDELSG